MNIVGIPSLVPAQTNDFHLQPQKDATINHGEKWEVSQSLDPNAGQTTT